MDKSVTSEITIHVNQTDNNARYKCEASNSATEVPLVDNRVLHVYCKPNFLPSFFLSCKQNQCVQTLPRMSSSDRILLN
jgi:hypothetical protein